MKWQGEFQIADWQEQTRESNVVLTGGKLTTAIVKQVYQGDIKGAGELQYSMVYDGEGNALFSGIELIQTELGAQNHILVLSHKGKFSQGVASSEFEVVACEPDHSIVGAQGQFTSGEGGKAEYYLEKRS
ncbi:DUF3224 domain-containing protein [Pseudoalteromonas luteoviolacea]|uniref:DUF3224 domain-containing protein n=1 Tax=Pseudoalteromonas luteoviolacea S4060-1 TaxID=1365257 RepID=A0A162BBG7_9GAMM|nr:DUF3224 domain-containing protein [Pseudoalteromonas luteoviolacea]KZN34063.1 hypothetical protein N480_23015 [Pseudoalteromonas luteoviolacea S2607]KZN69648.1 hypothetical protein N478_10905 [Pseudoalteromonas luteoviolacea S4060-1]